MYERVIREARTRDDLNAYVHATSLRQVWGDLFLPLPVRAAWEASFPELRECKHGDSRCPLPRQRHRSALTNTTPPHPNGPAGTSVDGDVSDSLVAR